jgi:hypothetical protein
MTGSRSIDQVTPANSFICKMAGDRIIGGINGRARRRAADRKRRIEAKKGKGVRQSVYE